MLPISHFCSECPQSQLHRAGISPCNPISTAGKCQQPPLWRQRAYWCHKTLWLITLFYTPIFFTMMRPYSPSTSECGVQRIRVIVFNKHEVHKIFSIHEEITPRMCKLATTNFAAAQKPTQAAEPTQELGQVLRGSSYSALTKALHLNPKTCMWTAGTALWCGCISSVTWSKLTCQSPNSRLNSGLQIGKGHKTTPSPSVPCWSLSGPTLFTN